MKPIPARIVKFLKYDGKPFCWRKRKTRTATMDMAIRTGCI
jgi:hypothetical protein